MTRARRVASVLLAGLLSIAAVACGDEPTTADTPEAPTDAPSGFDAIARAQQVPALIRDHLGFDPEIRRLTLSPSGFSVQVRDPHKRDNLDDHDFSSGQWTTRPVSVSVSEIAEYESVTFHLSDISWPTVPKLVRRALDGLDLEGEEIGAVGFDRLSGEAVRVYISVNGLRGSGRLIAGADGSNVDVQRN